MKRKGTFTDVARAAGTSVATVSRVATGTARVSLEVEKRVRNTAAKLGIDLSRQNKARMVAFLLSNRDRLHPFHSRVLVGSEDYCAQRGYNVVFSAFRYPLTAGWREVHLPRFSERRQSVDGLIVGGTNSPALLDLLSRKRFPFAAFGNNIVGKWPQEDHDVVWSDDIHGAYEMTRYLQSLGHRMIWFVGNSRLPWFERSHSGYERAMLEASLACHAANFVSENAQEVGYLATKSILRSGDQVSAIVAGDTIVASGAYRALRDSGLKIPQDVSVAGIGESGAEMLEPPLTRLHEFPEQVGSELARLVLEKIEKSDLPPRQVVVPTQLVKRESCGPPIVLSFVGANRS